MIQKAKVYLVGTGPGDPELLTVKALRLLQTAEVVVYDRLVSDEILDLIPPGTTRIYVGKKTGKHTLPQDEINALLVRLSETPRQIVRLKGGDPFIFGRGSEEALYLARHDIPFEIVPGITAASACTTYAGIPLTHRGLSRGVEIVTGHCRGDRPLDLDWQALANPDRTLVIYMGLANIDEIRDGLIGAGLPPDTPAAVIEQGTTARQRRLSTTVAELPQRVRASGVQAPALFVIGKVVALAETLDWFVPQGASAIQVVEREQHG
ncbi:MAG TPA: uroporphyrinogen-III C-methyltransferase [Methylothermaceae bacterium]|nr:uroporphyrinogen-III C-methyltransferase [Methylothermaceae bacterium]